MRGAGRGRRPGRGVVRMGRVGSCTGGLRCCAGGRELARPARTSVTRKFITRRFMSSFCTFTAPSLRSHSSAVMVRLELDCSSPDQLLVALNGLRRQCGSLDRKPAHLSSAHARRRGLAPLRCNTGDDSAGSSARGGGVLRCPVSTPPRGWSQAVQLHGGAQNWLNVSTG